MSICKCRDTSIEEVVGTRLTFSLPGFALLIATFLGGAYLYASCFNDSLCRPFALPLYFFLCLPLLVVSLLITSPFVGGPWVHRVRHLVSSRSGGLTTFFPK